MLTRMLCAQVAMVAVLLEVLSATDGAKFIFRGHDNGTSVVERLRGSFLVDDSALDTVIRNDVVTVEGRRFISVFATDPDDGSISIDGTKRVDIHSGSFPATGTVAIRSRLAVDIQADHVVSITGGSEAHGVGVKILSPREEVDIEGFEGVNVRSHKHLKLSASDGNVRADGKVVQIDSREVTSINGQKDTVVGGQHTYLVSREGLQVGSAKDIKIEAETFLNIGTGGRTRVGGIKFTQTAGATTPPACTSANEGALFIVAHTLSICVEGRPAPVL